MTVAPATEQTQAQADRQLADERRSGWMLALLATFAFSFAPPVARAAITGGFNSTTLLMLRAVIAAVLFGFTLAVTDRQMLRLPRRGLGAMLFLGAVNAVGMLLFFSALNYLDSSLTSMILALSPPMVISLLALRGERLSGRDLLRLGIALVGVFFLIGPTGRVDWFGAALALAATFLFSFQLAFTQWALIAYPSRTISFYVTASMALFVALYWWLAGAEWVAPTAGGWLAVVMLAFVSTYLARLSYYSAVRKIGSGQIALLGPLETLLSVIWSILFLGERLSPLQIIGGALILGSALLAVRTFRTVNLRIPRR